MPFREKAKNLFKTKSRADSQSSRTTRSSDRDRYPSNVYKPGEPMPKPKYRAPPKKEHAAKLEAFNFTNAWRKSSMQSLYSPMGTRAPSRRSSWLSRKSATDSRANSVTSGDTDASGGLNAAAVSARLTTARDTALSPDMTTQPEQEGDDDVANVGLSPKKTHHAAATKRRDMKRKAGTRPPPPSSNVTAHDHHPFTEHDLSRAMQRSHMAVSAQS